MKALEEEVVANSTVPAMTGEAAVTTEVVVVVMNDTDDIPGAAGAKPVDGALQATTPATDTPVQPSRLASSHAAADAVAVVAASVPVVVMVVGRAGVRDDKTTPAWTVVDNMTAATR